MEVEEIRTVRLRHEVLRAGEGRPLLLLHGLTGDKEAWSGIVDPLAAGGWEVVAADQRGHGRSEWPVPAAAYTLDALVADAWALADRLGWEDDVVVVGHSLGGVVGQLMALGAPDRVAGLVLVATIPGGVGGGRPGGARALAGRIKRSGLGLVGRVRRPGPPDRSDATFSTVMVEGLVASLASAPDRSRALGSIEVPVLVIGGADDPLVPGSYALAEALPQGRLVVLDGVGHEVPTDATERLRREVVTFLDALPAPRP